MVPSDWDLALTCICGPNFRSNSSENSPDFFIWEFSRSNSSENSPDFLFVCLFVWLNKTRTVKPLRRFHAWSSIFTQDGLAFSTKTARRVFLFVCLSIPSPLCICNRDKRPHFSLKLFRLDSKQIGDSFPKSMQGRDSWQRTHGWDSSDGSLYCAIDISLQASAGAALNEECCRLGKRGQAITCKLATARRRQKLWNKLRRRQDFFWLNPNV